MIPSIVQGGASHSEYAILEITDTVAELQERERYPQGDEGMNEEPTKDVVRHAP